MEDKIEITQEEKEELTEEEKKARKKTELIRSLKYLMFTFSAGTIQFLSNTFLEEVVHLAHWPSYLIALVLSVIWNFTLNRRYTFKSANNVPIAMLKVTAYYLVFTPLSTWLDAWLTGSCGWPWYFATITIMMLNLATEFPFQRFVVFRNSLDTNDLAEKEKTKKDTEENDE